MAKYLDENGLTHFWSRIKAIFLTDVTWDSAGNKLQKTKNATVSDVHTFAAVATSGDYDDLVDKPTLAAVATSGSYNDLTNKPTITDTNVTQTVVDTNDTHPLLFTTPANLQAQTTGPVSFNPQWKLNASTGALTVGTISTDGANFYEIGGAAAGSASQLIPSGGSANYVLAKNSATDYDLKWVAQTANTDTKVTQTVDTSTSGTSAYPILLKNTTATATITDTARFDAAVKVVPATGEIQATKFNGVSIINGADSMLIAGTSGGIEANGDYYLDAACEYGVDTSISAGSTSTNLPTTAAVVSYVATTTAGALSYQGTATSNSDLGTTYKKGYYWIVGSAGGTIAGQTVEAGDMVLAHADYSGTIANDVDIVQSNVERITNTEIDTIMAA